MSGLAAFLHSRRSEFLIGAILLSLVVHYALSSYVVKYSSLSDHTWIKHQPLKITLVTPEILKKKIEEKAPKQVVQNSDKGRDEESPDAKFLGEKTQTYDRQTTVANVDKFHEAKNQTRHEKKSPFSPAKELTLADLGMGRPVYEKPEPKSEEVVVLESKPAATNDYLNELPMGDMVALNTVEFKYYGFYNRIRQKLEQYWGASLQRKTEVIYKSGRRLASGQDSITALLVTMDNLGNITQVVIKTTSGYSELDDAAIESFRAAGPFPNPPKGLVVDGKAVIEWGFVVKS